MVKALEEKAYKYIEENLDVISLLREINNLKILTHLFLNDYQRRLVPLVALSLPNSVPPQYIANKQGSIFNFKQSNKIEIVSIQDTEQPDLNDRGLLDVKKL